MLKCTLLAFNILLALTIQDFEVMRKEMVNDQIIKRGITDAMVIKALEKVPRHLFVPADLQAFAYDDRPLPIGYNQTISQPYIVAYMTEQLRLKQGDKVLEIGTGSGYQAAILAEIVKDVYTIEIVKALGQQAASTLDSLDYQNIHCKVGDGYHGWPSYQPFDAIMLTASPDVIPQPLFDQLKEGGRLIAPLEKDGHQQLVLYTKTKGLLKRKELIGVRFVPFVH